MRLLPSLLRRLYRAINPDPNAYVAMRLTHPDGGQWSITDATLTVQALTNPRPPPVTIDLTRHTMQTLATALTMAGWQVDALTAEHRARGAVALIDGDGQGPSSPLRAHDSVLWALMDAYALELGRAAEAADMVPRQLSASTAEGYWLDELGRYYGIARLPLEPDTLYAPRLVEEVLRPKSNNVAMASIIQATTGQPTTVRDVTVYRGAVPAYDGSFVHDGSYFHDADSQAVYGLFDVLTTFDLLGDGDILAFTAAISEQVERLRAAGTYMRTISVTGGNIPDTAAGPQAEPAGIADLGLAIGSALTETQPAPDDAALSSLGGLDAADAAPAPIDAAPEAAAATTIEEAAPPPADTGHAADGGIGGLADTADAPDDSAAMDPLALVNVTDTAPTPAELVGADATLATMADPADPPSDTGHAAAGTLTDLAEAAGAPSDPGPEAAGSLAGMVDTVAGAADTASAELAFTHRLDGTWTLNGKRPLSSGVILTEAL